MTSAAQRRAAVHAICDDLAGNCDVSEDILAPIRGWADALVRPRGVVRLDDLAANARTALDDPHGLPDTERDWRGAHPAESKMAALSYAIAQCDAIIEALDPVDVTAASSAVTLRVLNAHVEKCASRIAEAESDPVCQVALGLVQRAIVLLGDAVRMLDKAPPS